MNREEINKITEKVIGLAIKIHSRLGPGFVEKIYEKAMIHEFEKTSLNYKNQSAIRVKYEELEIGNQRVDFVVAGEVIVEIKSVSKINDIFEYQMISYLKTSEKRVGLILNFGQKKLEIKRIVNNF